MRYKHHNTIFAIANGVFVAACIWAQWLVLR